MAPRYTEGRWDFDFLNVIYTWESDFLVTADGKKIITEQKDVPWQSSYVEFITLSL